jgi:hypothetical protein
LYGSVPSHDKDTNETTYLYENYLASVHTNSNADTWKGNIAFAITNTFNDLLKETDKAARDVRVDELYTLIKEGGKSRDNAIKYLRAMGLSIDSKHYSDDVIKSIAINLGALTRSALGKINDSEFNVEEMVARSRRSVAYLATKLSYGYPMSAASSYYDGNGNRVYTYTMGSSMYNVDRSLKKNIRTLFFDESNPITRNNFLIIDRKNIRIDEHIELDAYMFKKDNEVFSDVDKMSDEQWYAVRFLSSYANELAHDKEGWYYQWVGRQSNRATEDAYRVKSLTLAEMNESLDGIKRMHTEMIQTLKRIIGSIMNGRSIKRL